MTRVTAIVLAVLLVAGRPAPADAYLKFGFLVGGTAVDVRWPAGAVPYFVHERDIAGVTAAELSAAIGRAAATWQSAPDVNLAFAFQGMTTATPGALDGRNTLGFMDRPDLDRVLGMTSIILDATTGAIVEADVFFNTAFPWSVAAGGESGRMDIESVALHELGHVIGLGHSALGETERSASGGRRVLGSGAVMFPIALAAGAVADRVLQADDRAGVFDLYGVEHPARPTGAIQGRVLKDGRGVFGAHVVAFNPVTGQMVGGFSLNTNGDFVVAGLEPGPHIVRVEPLDDGDVESFLAGIVDVDFGVAYAPRLVVAPRGGTSGPIDIVVRAK